MEFLILIMAGLIFYPQRYTKYSDTLTIKLINNNRGNNNIYHKVKSIRSVFGFQFKVFNFTLHSRLD